MYEVKFTQLSRYALVSTKRNRCRRFEEGLEYDIRIKISPRDLRSSTNLRAETLRAECLIKDKPIYFQELKIDAKTFSNIPINH